MPDAYYELTAVSSLPDQVALYIATGGIPRDLAPDEIPVIWQDIVQCFMHSGFSGVADILKMLRHEWVSSGVFTIHGPSAQRQHLFRRLSQYRGFRSGRSAPSGSISVEFFRSQEFPHLSVHLHQGAVHSWCVDQMPPPPILRCQSKNLISA